MKKNLIIFIGGLVILILGVFFIMQALNNKTAAPTEQAKTNQAPVNTNLVTPIDPQELENNYTAKVKEILAPFLTGKSSKNINKQLLELTVPGKYKDLHLDLVIAFSELEQGKLSSDQDIIEAALEKIDNLKTKYPWLAEK